MFKYWNETYHFFLYNSLNILINFNYKLHLFLHNRIIVYPNSYLFSFLTHSNTYTMDLSERVVLLKASVKEGEYPTFTPEDIIFLFEVILSEEVTCPEGVILGYPDPSGWDSNDSV